MTNNEWSPINDATTDQDGRCKYLLPAAHILQPGTYRVRFEAAVYYRQHQLDGLYPYIEIVFTVTDSEQHYHIPLLLTANGYTTYRGS
jgi:5-hydroxyisourate hydrolase